MKRVAPFALALGVVALAAIVYYAGAGAIGQALATLGFGGFAIICLVHLPVIGLLGLAWWTVSRDIEGARSWKFMWARLVRESAAEVLPFSQVGGFVIGARALTLAGLRTLPVAVTMLVDLVMELSAKLPYLIAGVVLLFVAEPGSDLLGPVSATVVVTGAGLVAAIVFRHKVKAGLEKLAIRLADRFPALGLGSGEDIRPAFDRVFARDWRILFGFSLHLLCWVLGAFETWLILTLMGIPVGPLEAVVIDALVSALRTIGFVVPAAVGVQEGGYLLVCGLFGIDPASAVALSLVRRAREFAIGLPGLAAWQAVEGKRALRRDVAKPEKDLGAPPTSRAPLSVE